MRKIIAVLPLMALLFSGCYTFKSATYYPEGKYIPTNPATVQIYRNAPPRAFEVIGETQLARGYFTAGDEKKLKEQAAAMGGDGVIWELKRDCTSMTLIPARTSTVVTEAETQSGNHTGKKEIATVESTPAQMQPNCYESIQGKIIKFTK